MAWSCGTMGPRTWLAYLAILASGLVFLGIVGSDLFVFDDLRFYEISKVPSRAPKGFTFEMKGNMLPANEQPWFSLFSKKMHSHWPRAVSVHIKSVSIWGLLTGDAFFRKDATLYKYIKDWIPTENNEFDKYANSKLKIFRLQHRFMSNCLPL